MNNKYKALLSIKLTKIVSTLLVTTMMLSACSTSGGDEPYESVQVINENNMTVTSISNQEVDITDVIITTEVARPTNELVRPSFEYSENMFNPETVYTDLFLEDFFVGNEVDYGSFYGAPLTWQILDVEENRALLFLNTVLWDEDGNYGYYPYDEYGSYVTWETSLMREWLNSDFYDYAFGEDNTAIVLTHVIAEGSDEVYQQWDDVMQEICYVEYHSEGGNDTDDYVFLLSENEVIKYESVIEGNMFRTFYLRTPSVNNHGTLTYSPIEGDISTCPIIDCGFVRPAMWIDISYFSEG